VDLDMDPVTQTIVVVNMATVVKVTNTVVKVVKVNMGCVEVAVLSVLQ